MISAPGIPCVSVGQKTMDSEPLLLFLPDGRHDGKLFQVSSVLACVVFSGRGRLLVESFPNCLSGSQCQSRTGHLLTDPDIYNLLESIFS